MSGTLWGVGVGPGDPSLMTLKAVEVLSSAAVVAVPDSGGDKKALAVAAAYIEGKEVLACPAPMTRDEEVLTAGRKKSADMICERLAEGSDVAFLTLGDPSIYSTYLYLHELVLERGYPARIVPGVPSFCAAAAVLGRPLCRADESLHVISASDPRLAQRLREKGCKAIMKSGRKMAEVLRTLEELGLGSKARIVEACGMEGEKVYRSLDEAKIDPGYLSIIIVEGSE